MKLNSIDVLFVGDRPSRWNDDPKVAFIGARCWPRLREWIEEMGVTRYAMINRTHPEFKYIVANAMYAGVKIVAIGKMASKALENVPHFLMPHPSGLNRQINNVKLVRAKIKACTAYLTKGEAS